MKTTPDIKLRFRKACIGEFHHVSNVLQEAAEWLMIKDVHQWDEFIIPSDFLKKWLYDGFKNGEFFFMEHRGRVAGIFRLSTEDQLFWGDEDGDAYYIHSLATASNYRGFNLSKKMMRWIETKTIRDGRNYMRLDCKMSNPFLQEFYEGYGFEPVRETEVMGQKFLLMQKEL